MCIWVVKSSALADLIPSLFLCKWLSGLTTESSIPSNGKFAENGSPSGELSAERSYYLFPGTGLQIPPARFLMSGTRRNL